MMESPKAGKAAVGLLATIVLVGLAGDGWAGREKRINRQISIMEKIIDEAMVDSRYALVRSTHPSHGVYLADYGPVFTLEVGLVDEDFGSLGSIWSRLGGDISIETKEGEDGEKVITIRSGKKKDRDGDDDEGKKGGEPDDAEKYAKVKDELIEVIRDYGDTIAKAKGDEWFTILASPLRGSWGDSEISRLVVRVRMKEITAYNRENLDEEGFRKKVQIIEY